MRDIRYWLIDPISGSVHADTMPFGGWPQTMRRLLGANLLEARESPLDDAALVWCDGAKHAPRAGEFDIPEREHGAVFGLADVPVAGRAIVTGGRRKRRPSSVANTSLTMVKVIERVTVISPHWHETAVGWRVMAAISKPEMIRAIDYPTRLRRAHREMSAKRRRA